MDLKDRLAVDSGGTFVDSITFDRETGEINVEKASTTPDQPERGVLNVKDKVGTDLARTTASS